MKFNVFEKRVICLLIFIFVLDLIGMFIKIGSGKYIYINVW